jgi:hypothetical protein
MNGLRYLSWTIVIVSTAWLFAGALRPLWMPVLRDMPIPDMASEQVAGAFVSAESPLGHLEPDPAEIRGPERLEPAVAVFSYDQLYPMLKTRERVSGLERVDAVVRVRTTLENLDPGQVVLTVDDGERLHRHTLGPLGELELPARKDWLERGLQVVSNQPPNSLRLSITFNLDPIPSEEIEYAWLAQTAEELEIAMDSLAGGEAAESRQILGLAFRFPPGQRGEVRVLSRRFGEEFLADPAGLIRFPFREELLAENPTVRFSSRPLRMMPLTR